MKPIYIFDLDGTLADGDHRLHYIRGGEKKDWRSYFAACAEDKLIEPVAHIFRCLVWGGAECRIWTGRSDEVQAQTIQWLHTHRLSTRGMLMRVSGDHRNDDVLKQEWLQELPAEDRARLRGVFEDRDRVVQMWRANGVQCFQVAPGDF